MAFPFPQASWGAAAHLNQPQQPSLAPDGMSITPVYGAQVRADAAIEGTQLQSLLPAPAAETARSGAGQGSKERTELPASSLPSSQSNPNGGQMWYAASNSAGFPPPSHVAQGHIIYEDAGGSSPMTLLRSFGFFCVCLLALPRLPASSRVYWLLDQQTVLTLHAIAFPALLYHHCIFL